VAYKVTAGLVSVKDPAGQTTYFYEGATVPDGFDAKDLERLVEAGLIAAEPEAKPAPRTSAK
jgi:hypothetical protein